MTNLKKLAGLIILSLTILVLLAACAPTPPPAECPPHVDEDKDLVCDVCGEDLTPEPDIPKLNFTSTKFQPITVTYDGKEHPVYIRNMPNDSNLTVEYVGNNPTEAGVHTVVAKFYYTLDGEKIYLENQDMTTTVTINKAVYDMSGVKAINTFVYSDGEDHSVTLVGELPEGVEAVFEKKSAVGKYELKVSFIGSKNYSDIPPLTASLEIIKGVDGIRGLTLTDISAVFNGKAILPEIADGMLTGGVTFLGADVVPRNAGEYTPTLRFAKDGVHNPSLDCKISVSVKKCNLAVDIPEVLLDFNGESQKIDLSDYIELNDCFTVREIGNKAVYPGEYDVQFALVPKAGEESNFEGKALLKTTMKIEYNGEGTEGLIIVADGGSYAVTGYMGSEKIVIIPETYNGRRVTRITNEAFRGTSVEFVYMPDSISNIGNGVFRDCKELCEVRFSQATSIIGAVSFKDSGILRASLPTSVTAIGYGAFEGTKIEEITLPFIGGSHNTSNPYLGYIFGADGYGGNERFVPETLKTVILNDACREVPEYSFFGCKSITEVKLGARVEKIGISAFVGTAIEKIYIPKSVVDIPARANNYNSSFWGLDGLKIYTEHDEAPEGYNVKWNIVGEKTVGTKVNPIYAEVLYSQEEIDYYS